MKKNVVGGPHPAASGFRSTASACQNYETRFWAPQEAVLSPSGLVLRILNPQTIGMEVESLYATTYCRTSHFYRVVEGLAGDHKTL